MIPCKRTATPKLEHASQMHSGIFDSMHTMYPNRSTRTHTHTARCVNVLAQA